MAYAGLEDFAARGGAALARGPVALILAEDGAEIAGTLRHHAGLGFAAQVLFAPPDLDLPAEARDLATVVSCDTRAAGAAAEAVSAVAAAAPAGTWLYWGYNAEYLFYPFCESRTVGELVAFHAEERRAAMLTYVVDLYAGDLGQHPDAVATGDAWLDRSGYYALARAGMEPGAPAPERQLDIHGGLRWRFEEHIPAERRRIDRIGLFRAARGLRLRPDNTLSEPEMNTYACPWHHNLTAAICSFRTAKALRANPGSREAIASFRWRNSVAFEWRSQQLMDLGLIEPGQWF